MLIKELINESPADVVARFYKNASQDLDARYNPENTENKSINQEHYNKTFDSWYKHGITPVFSKPAHTTDTVYNTTPEIHKTQSAGYRGLQYALASAGLPYDKNVQMHTDNPASLLAKQTKTDL